MPQKKFLQISSLLLVYLLISGCAMFRGPEDRVVVQTKILERQIPLQANPKPVTLGEPTFYVVTEENFDEFIEKYKKENGDPWVFYAMSVRSYETLALNVAEIRRYLEQQKQIIIYYENAVKNNNTEDSQDGKK